MKWIIESIVKMLGPKTRWWLIATAGSAAIGAVVIAILFPAGLNPTGAVSFGMMGACIGVGQWLVLHRYLHVRAIWIPVTLLAFIGFWLFPTCCGTAVPSVLVGTGNAGALD